MRPIAIGRRNWTFAGSDAGGARAAAIYSLIETAKINRADPEDYLRKMLDRIAAYSVDQVVDAPVEHARPQSYSINAEPHDKFCR